MKIVAPAEQWDTCLSLATACAPQQGEAYIEDRTIPVEHNLEIYVDDVLSYRLVCSPVQLTELVLGRLLTDGVISGAEDVEILYLCQEGLRARVFLNGNRALCRDEVTVQATPTCCTGNQVITRLIAADEAPRVLKPLAYQSDWIFTLSEALNQNNPLYMATHNVHSCILMHRGEILTSSEDIGRHNAMDKVLGWALVHQIPLEECILYTSGRVPVDMTIKAIRAGVPILVSKAMPTQQAVELARQHGLTLIGAAHPDSFRVFK